MKNILIHRKKIRFSILGIPKFQSHQNYLRYFLKTSNSGPHLESENGAQESVFLLHTSGNCMYCHIQETLSYSLKISSISFSHPKNNQPQKQKQTHSSIIHIHPNTQVGPNIQAENQKNLSSLLGTIENCQILCYSFMVVLISELYQNSSWCEREFLLSFFSRFCHILIHFLDHKIHDKSTNTFLEEKVRLC